MKKLISTITFALFATIMVNAQQGAQETIDNSNNPNAPEIKFVEEVYDFGSVPYAGNGVHDFKFTNSGKETLIISNARGSCGCTVPKWPKEPVKAGESNVINVSYDTKREGPFTKTVTITSNAKTSNKVITIKGVVMSQTETENQSPVKKNSMMAPLENSPTKNQ